MQPNEMDGFVEPVFICYIAKIMLQNALSI